MSPRLGLWASLNTTVARWPVGMIWATERAKRTETLRERDAAVAVLCSRFDTPLMHDRLIVRSLDNRLIDRLIAWNA